MSGNTQLRVAPVLHPTSEEFRNPMKYFESVRAIGNEYGIVVVQPPASFRPGFSLDPKKLKFYTRQQNLHMVGAESRAETEFMLQVRMFMFRNGTPLPTVAYVLKEQPVPFRDLYHAVGDFGGFEEVEKQPSVWRLIFGAVFPKLSCFAKSAAKPELDEAINSLRVIYRQVLYPFECRHRSKPPSSAHRPSEQAQLNASGGSTFELVYVNSDNPASLTSKVETTSVENKSVATALTLKLRNTMAEAQQDASAPSAGRDADVAGDSADEHVGAHGWRYVPQLKASLWGRIVKRHPEYGYQLVFDLSHSRNRATAVKLMQQSKQARKILFDGYSMYLQKARSSRASASADPPPFFADWVPHSDIAIIRATGRSAAEAAEAFKSGVCQICLRANREDAMLMCDYCDMTYHMDCLNPPIASVPAGDWFCETCVQEISSKTSQRRFGFHQEPFPVSLAEFRDCSRKIVSEFLGSGNDPVLTSPDDLAALSSLPSFQKREGVEGESTIFDAVAEHDWSSAHSITVIAKLEEAFWRAVNTPAARAPHKWDENSHKFVPVAMPHYGADIDTAASGSGFPARAGCGQTATDPQTDYAPRQTPSAMKRHRRKRRGALTDVDSSNRWNLNSLPYARGSLLKHVPEDITGITVPWMYFGMACSTFCWHTEDHYFASINYIHWGAPKVWYGLPSSAAAGFDSLMRERYADLIEQSPDGNLFKDIVTMVDPATLIAAGLPVCRAIHQPGQFVVTFPKSYHAGFNAGINCAEAVNFATPSWLRFFDRAGDPRVPVVDTCDLVFRATKAFLESTTLQAEYVSQLPTHQPAELSLINSASQSKHKSGAVALSSSVGKRAVSLVDIAKYLQKALQFAYNEGTLRQDGCKQLLSDNQVERVPQPLGSESVGLQCTQCQQYAVFSCLQCTSCKAVCCGLASCAAASSSACGTQTAGTQAEMEQEPAEHNWELVSVRQPKQFQSALHGLR